MATASAIVKAVMSRAALAVATGALCLGAVEVLVRVAVYNHPEVRVAARPGLIFEMKPGAGRTNGRGFRGPEYETAARQGTCRVAVLGDSVTFGSGLGDEGEGFVRKLEVGLRARAGRGQGFEILNAGVQGYNLEQSAANFVYNVRPWRPAVTVYAFFVNDLDDPHDLLAHPDSGARFQAIMPHAFAAWRPGWSPAWDDFLSHYWRTYLFFRTRYYSARVMPQLAADRSAESHERRLAVARALLSEFAARVRTAGAEFVVFGIPPHVISLGAEACDNRELYGMKNYCRTARQRIALVADWARQNGVPFVDGSPAYDGAPGTDFRVEGLGADYVHPNADGHSRLAAELLRAWPAVVRSAACRVAGGGGPAAPVGK